MIWYECKQCRKKQGKADNLAGTLVFCDCGQGNRVPWSSSIPEPPPEPTESIPSRPKSMPTPRNRPNPLDDDQEWRGRWSERRDPEDEESENRRPADHRAPQENRDDFPLPRRKQQRLRRVRSEYCFNHEDDPPEATCEDCKIPFCARCLISLQGRKLCGPCKNFRVAVTGRPARLAPMALIAFIVALVSGPITLVLTFWAFGLQVNEGIIAGAVALCLISALISGTGVYLGWLTLRQIDRTPHVSGGSLGTSAAVASAVGLLWSLTLGGFLILKAIQG